jgi:hypothetical protein
VYSVLQLNRGPSSYYISCNKCNKLIILEMTILAASHEYLIHQFLALTNSSSRLSQSNDRTPCLCSNNTARSPRQSSSFLFHRCVFKSFIVEKDLLQDADATRIFSAICMHFHKFGTANGLQRQPFNVTGA